MRGSRGNQQIIATVTIPHDDGRDSYIVLGFVSKPGGKLDECSLCCMAWRKLSVFTGPTVLSILVLALPALLSANRASAQAPKMPDSTHLVLNAAGHLVIADQGTGMNDSRLPEAVDLNADSENALTEIARDLPSIFGGNSARPSRAGVSDVPQAPDRTYWSADGGEVMSYACLAFTTRVQSDAFQYRDDLMW